MKLQIKTNENSCYSVKVYGSKKKQYENLKNEMSLASLPQIGLYE